jgi:hypothetical protein
MGRNHCPFRIKGRNGAVGDGPTPEAVIADMREALEVLFAETGPPDELGHAQLRLMPGNGG